MNPVCFYCGISLSCVVVQSPTPLFSFATRLSLQWHVSSFDTSRYAQHPRVVAAIGGCRWRAVE